MKKTQRAGMEDRNTRLSHRDVLNQWRAERKLLHQKLKSVSNPHFGSVFRTHHNPSQFADKIRNYADLYTSNLENFTEYPLSYVFYPERTFLPHEHTVGAWNIDVGGSNIEYWT